MKVLCKPFQIDVRYTDNARTVWYVIRELYILALQNSVCFDCLTATVCGDD